MTDTSTVESTEDPATEAQPDLGADAAAGGTYELLRRRLLDHAADLSRRAEALNSKRIETFGSTRFEIAGSERIRTENNAVPRDIAAVGNAMVFAYNVFIGLKTETAVDDVFSLHTYTNDGDGFRLDPIPTTTDTNAPDFLHDPGFVADFRELYTYYKDARLVQLLRKDQQLLAVFQFGQAADDLRVFRWAVSPDGHATYVDNRGEREYRFPPQYDFEWIAITREHHVTGRRPLRQRGRPRLRRPNRRNAGAPAGGQHRIGSGRADRARRGRRPVAHRL